MKSYHQFLVLRLEKMQIKWSVFWWFLLSLQLCLECFGSRSNLIVSIWYVQSAKIRHFWWFHISPFADFITSFWPYFGWLDFSPWLLIMSSFLNFWRWILDSVIRIFALAKKCLELFRSRGGPMSCDKTWHPHHQEETCAHLCIYKTFSLTLIRAENFSKKTICAFHSGKSFLPILTINCCYFIFFVALLESY